jgi:hypothetical protein
LGLGVKLAGSPAKSQLLKDDSQLSVTGSAIENQVDGVAVFLMAINMADLNISSGTTKGAYSLARKC